jgi:amidase
MFEQAMADAAELDEHMRIYHTPKGPLHGLPISVKEHIELENTPATSGFVAWANEISTSDALIIKVLRQAGAVFHVKTTDPQSLMVKSSINLLSLMLTCVDAGNCEQFVWNHNKST